MTAPLPPPDFAIRPLDVTTIPKDTILSRFYPARFAPIHFDSGSNGRFNAPNGSYGVLYAAASRNGAFAETFLRQPGRQSLPLDLVRSRAFVRLAALRDLTLCHFTGPGLAKAGATAEVAHGGLPYDVPQVWSAAIDAHPAKVDGIAYKARHDDEQECYALFSRVRGQIAETSRVTMLDADWFWRIALRYGVGLSP